MRNAVLKTLLLGTFLLLLGNNVMAQSVKDLKKQNKEIISKLRKQNKLKKVEICIEDDGFWFFLLRKGSVIGVANQRGEIVVPVQYKEVTYYPAQEDGFSYIPCYGFYSGVVESQFALYHTASPAVWCAKSSYDASIYSMDGDILRTLSLPVQYLPGYFFSGVEKPIKSRCSDDVVNQKKNGYKSIFVYTNTFCSIYEQDADLLLEQVRGAIFYENKSLTYTRLIDGEEREGGILLSDTTSKVPCQFYYVSYDDYSWKVKRTSFSEREYYSPYIPRRMENKSRYRDEGERYFEKCEFDSVIDFYSKEGVSAPWAKYLIAESFQHKASSHTVNCSSVISAITKETSMSSFVLEHQNDYYAFDLTQALELYQTAIKYYDAYLQEDFSKEYSSEAKSRREFVLSQIAELPILQANYEKALKLLEQRNEHARLAEIQRQQAAAQLKREVTARIIGIFINALSDAVPSSSQTSVSQGNNNYSGVSSGTSTSSSSKDYQKTAHPRKCTSCAHVGNGKCKMCRGTGKWYNTASSAYQTCPHCNGTGKCQVCNGTGTTGNDYY